jgi:hypothetical protein
LSHQFAASRGLNAMEQTMMKNRMIALGVAGALAVAASATASAGPLSIDTGVQNALVQTTDVAWRGHRGGWGWGGPALGIGAGLAAGALIGSAVAGSPYGGYYYDDPGYVYAQPYASPGYYGYGYRNWGRCFTDEGYGRRTPCDTTGR